MSTSQTDFEQARFNMIEQQVRTWEVLDQRVLDTMSRIPREDFVPQRYRSLAFADTNIPLGNKQVMMDAQGRGQAAAGVTHQTGRQHPRSRYRQWLPDSLPGEPWQARDQHRYHA